MNKLLKSIEEKATRFGLFFNKTKCVSLPFNTNVQPKFANGDTVPTEEKTRYLGGIIQKKTQRFWGSPVKNWLLFCYS